ncbi:MAG TPA: hypothetical protein PKD61_05145 [Polyangiaceae bacterium]|nr:hypothetical protein [Polyangiaceae bacterium]
MAIASVLLSIEPDQELQARAALGERPELTLGATIAGRIPAVVESGDARSLEQLLRDYCGAPGVLFADVVGVDFGEELENLHATA